MAGFGILPPARCASLPKVAVPAGAVPGNRIHFSRSPGVGGRRGIVCCGNGPLSDAEVTDIVAFLEALNGPFPQQTMPRLPPTPGDLLE